jgi:hypothetical protein
MNVGNWKGEATVLFYQVKYKINCFQSLDLLSQFVANCKLTAANVGIGQFLIIVDSLSS